MVSEPLSLGSVTSEQVNLLFTEFLVPRALGWVLTQSAEGAVDIAPFSSFAPVCNKPPLVLFSAGRRVGGLAKLTTRNILSTKEFVIHLVDRSLIEALVATAVPGDEFPGKLDAAQLITAPSRHVRVPRILRCPLALECRLHRHLGLGDGEEGSDLLIGEVLALWKNENFSDAHIVAALGIGRYVCQGQIVHVPNPD